MTRKGLFVLVLAPVVAGGIFAQEETADVKRLWLSVETNLLGAGVRGEYMLTPKLSAGLNAYLFFDNIGISAIGRFYPWGKTFYAGLGFGLGVHSGIEPIANIPYTGWFIMRFGFDIVHELGWKIDAGNPGGFFLNPLVQVPLTFGDQLLVNMGGDYGGDFGFCVSLRVSLGLGWAF